MHMVKKKIRLLLPGAILVVAALAATLAGCAQSSSSQGQSSSRGSNGNGGGQFQGRQGQAGGQQGAQGRGGTQSYALHFAAIPVQTTTSRIDDLIADHQVSATVVPALQSNVVAQASGVVKQVLHHAGDWVKAGDVIVKLDDAQLSLSVKNAQANLENAEINLSSGRDNTAQSQPQLQLQLQSNQTAVDSAQRTYDSDQALYKNGLISQSALDSAKSALDQAKANLEAAKKALSQNQNANTQSLQQLQLSVTQAQNQLEQARMNLANTSITAPFDGQISAVNVSVGEYAGANTTAFTIVSATTELSFSVPPGDAPGITLGDTLTFSYGGTSQKAKVSRSPSAPINGVVPIVAELAGGPPPIGTVGTVTYSLPLARGALVPIASLQTTGNNTFVYEVANGKATVQVVNVLAEAGDTAAVQNLSNGAQIIVSPPPGLIDGAPVTPQPAAARAGTGAGTTQQASALNGGATSPGSTATRGTAGQGAGSSGGYQRQSAQGAQGGQTRQTGGQSSASGRSSGGIQPAAGSNQ